MLPLRLVLLLVAGCSAASAPMSVAPIAPACAPPRAAETTEVRATIDGATCVAFVDEDLSAVQSRPAIWRRDRDGWHELHIEDLLPNTGWVGAAASGDVIVAALDSRVESPAWELTVVRSHDRGATWSAPVQVRKPYYLATFEALELAPDGSATLVVVLDDDYGAGVAPGRYRLPVAP